nr:PREDICTED: 65-kDa microtubule-associated protein 6 [Daucus carota subsp. sativus]
MAPQLEISVREPGGLTIWTGPPFNNSIPSVKLEKIPCSSASFCENGARIMVINPGSGICIYDATSFEQVRTFDVVDTLAATLSPCGTYLQTFQKPVNPKNVTLWDIGSGDAVYQLFQKNMLRAERARITVTKIPAIVDSLTTKTVAWENERRKQFLYDGARLVSILDDYKLTRQQKEEAKKRYKDQKKLQDLLLTEKESIYGSKPSPRRSPSFRKTNGYHANGNGSMTPTPRRNSVGCATPELMTPRSYSGRQNGHFKEMRRLSTAPLNFVAMGKEDIISFSSVCGSEPGSPPHS